MVLDMSRSSMERLLAIVTKQFPNFKCINSNDGVKINFTHSVKIEDLPPLKKVDKKAEIKNIKADHFLHKNRGDNYSSGKLLSHFYTLNEALRLDENIKSENDLYVSASKIFEHLKKDRDPLTHYLMRGTVNCYLGAIFENTLYCASEKDF